MNQQLVKSLMVEIDGDMEKLRRALRTSGVELNDFAQKSTRTGAAAGAAADATASKQANAARSIAMATETIARQGAVSGETAKQLIAQGANLAFMFGAGGAIVGAFGIMALAGVSAFTRVRREIEETAEKAEESVARMVNAGDVDGLKNRARELYIGTAANDYRDGIRAREQRIAELTRRQPEGAADAVSGLSQVFGGRASAEIARQIREEQEALAPLRAEYDAFARTILNLQNVRSARPDNTVRISGRDPKADAASAARASAEELKERQQFEQRLSAMSSEAQEARYAEFQRRLKDGFAGTRADVERAFEQAVAFAETHGEQAEIPVLRNARDRALELIDLLARSDALLNTMSARDFSERIGRSDAAPLTGDTAREAAAMRAIRDQARAMAADQARSDADRDAAGKEALKQQDALEALIERQLQLRQKETAELIAQAQAVGQAVDGALQLMAAWGGVRREVVDVLRGVVQIGANVPNMLAKLNVLQDTRAAGGTLKDAKGNIIATTASATTGLASAALPIIGALATIGTSLLGDSPAEQERKRVQQENTRAIDRLTKQVGLSIDVSGTDWVSVRGELDRLMAGEMRARYVSDLNDKGLLGPGGSASEMLRRQMFGMSAFSDSARIDWTQMADVDRDLLERTAQELGVTLDDTVGSFRRLMEAIAAAEGKLFEFSDSYEDQTTLAGLTIQAKQITDPIERAMAEFAPALAKSPLLRELFANADLSTPEGRAALRDAVLALLETMQNGGDALDPSLVGLTFDQLIDVLGSLLDSLDGLDSQLPQSQGSSLGGISGFRGLTEAAGERMSDYLKAMVGQSSEHLTLLRAQLAELTRIASTPFTLPAIPGVTIPSGASAGGALVVNVGDVILGGITIVYDRDTPPDGAAIARAALQGMSAEIEQVIYDAVLRAKRVSGDLSVIPRR